MTVKRIAGALVLATIVLGLAAGCGPGRLGTENNPIIMSFVPSGDTEEIIAGGNEIADMITEKTGLKIVANVGTDYTAVREAMDQTINSTTDFCRRSSICSKIFIQSSEPRSKGRK